MSLSEHRPREGGVEGGVSEKLMVRFYNAFSFLSQQIEGRGNN